MRTHVLRFGLLALALSAPGFLAGCGIKGIPDENMAEKAREDDPATKRMPPPQAGETPRGPGMGAADRESQEGNADPASATHGVGQDDGVQP
jgi:hypothetical protein